MVTNPKLFEIADKLANLSVLEAKELINILENDYGIKAPEAIVGQPTVNENKSVIIEQTEFNVYLKESGAQKLQIVKRVKELINLGLVEAKLLVDSAPCLLREKVSKVDAETLKNELENLGAVIEIV